MGIAAGLPFIVNALGDNKKGYGFIWMSCGSVTALATIFIYVFMRETKGKSL